MSSPVAKLIAIGLATMSLVALGGFPVVVAFQASPIPAVPGWFPMITSFFAAVAIVAFVARCSPLACYVDEISVHVARKVNALPLVASLVIGLLLRGLLTLWLQPQPASDGATYVALARQLAETGHYGSSDALANWPPGMPLLLYPAAFFGLSSVGMSLVLGGGSFALAWAGLRSLLERLGCTPHAGVSLWLLALWPSHLFSSTLPEKELIVMALLPWMVERILTAGSSQGIRAASAVLQAGFIAGLAVLVQPSLQLLPLAVLAGALVLCSDRRRILLLAVLGLGGAALVVGGWTYRNLQVLHAPVLVSTNGGSVLYRANNDMATGAYIPQGSVDLSHMPELAQDREYKRLAFVWIAENPGRFAQLAVAKAMLFMGDDSYGPYAVFSRGNVEIDRLAYLGLKLFSTLCWLMLWAFILRWSASFERVAHALQRGGGVRAQALVWLPVFYLFAIHSVFESGSKYHIPLLALVLTWPALWLRSNTQQGTR